MRSPSVCFVCLGDGRRDGSAIQNRTQHTEHGIPPPSKAKASQERLHCRRDAAFLIFVDSFRFLCVFVHGLCVVRSTRMVLPNYTRIQRTGTGTQTHSHTRTKIRTYIYSSYLNFLRHCDVLCNATGMVHGDFRQHLDRVALVPFAWRMMGHDFILILTCCGWFGVRGVGCV